MLDSRLKVKPSPAKSFCRLAFLNALFLSIGLFLSAPVFSATQGQLGTNSTASVDVTLTLGRLSRITGLRDFTFAPWAGGDLFSDDNICIGLFGTNQYRISATGDGNGVDINAFALTNGSEFLPYRVFFNDQIGLLGHSELFSTNDLVGQTASNTFFNLFGCLNENANVQVLIENESLAKASSGSYSGLLTLVLIPE